jgi:hypothetical protein
MGVLHADDPYAFRLIRNDGRVRHRFRLPRKIGFVHTLSWRPPVR